MGTATQEPDKVRYSPITHQGTKLQPASSSSLYFLDLARFIRRADSFAHGSFTRLALRHRQSHCTVHAGTRVLGISEQTWTQKTIIAFEAAENSRYVHPI